MFSYNLHLLSRSPWSRGKPKVLSHAHVPSFPMLPDPVFCQLLIGFCSEFNAARTARWWGRLEGISWVRWNLCFHDAVFLTFHNVCGRYYRFFFLSLTHALMPPPFAFTITMTQRITQSSEACSCSFAQILPDPILSQLVFGFCSDSSEARRGRW